MKFIFVMTGMKDRIKMQIVNFGHRTNVARHTDRNFGCFISLQSIEMRDLESFPPLSNEYLVSRLYRPLMNSENTHASDIRIDINLEYVANKMIGRVAGDLDRLDCISGTTHEFREIGF